MRKFIFVAAMVLASATAQAGEMRSLTLASSDQPATPETPKFVARPAVVDTATEAPKAETTKPVAEKNTQATRVEKQRRRRESTEARVIYELHRHGIYW